MNELHSYGPFANSGSHPFDRAMSHISDGEEAGRSFPAETDPGRVSIRSVAVRPALDQAQSVENLGRPFRPQRLTTRFLGVPQ